VDQAYDIDTFFDNIDSFTQKRSVIYFDAPGSGGWKDNSSTNIHNQRIHSLFESSLKPLNPCISEMRLIKDKEEVKNMQDAADLASEAHMSAMRVASPGLYEHNVASVFDSQFTNGNSEHSYPPIVASGENACILHYNENNQELQDGDLLLIDAGCEINGYASDITRTFPINGKFSEAQKEIYGIVLSAQKSAIDSIKPGVSCNKPHETACQIITDGLIKLGIMKSPEDLTKFYMHGTGHWLGLDVHDVGIKLINDEFREFKSGMVTTVEPGIYIRRDDKIESKYWGIGVRIEDDVLVTEAGNHVLSKKAVKDIDEIEYLMSQR
jgi:Xaa-Pro aminopeptidase